MANLLLSGAACAWRTRASHIPNLYKMEVLQGAYMMRLLDDCFAGIARAGPERLQLIGLAGPQRASALQLRALPFLPDAARKVLCWGSPPLRRWPPLPELLPFWLIICIDNPSHSVSGRTPI